jgi:2-hydroxy-3-keto-5-methylthiopentenyl-1-phosphate phosphatase
MTAKRAVLSDFDGTITRVDVGEAILEEFAPPQWREIEERYRARKIGTRESMALQLALVRAGREELLHFVDRIAVIDETFREFVEFCQAQGLVLEIVSEGLDFYVEYLLQKWDLQVPFRTNHTIFEEGRVRMDYPWADATCKLCGTCKLLRLFELRTAGYRTAYVGNGHSDLCPAIEADLVFAKSNLADLCRTEEIDFIPFDRFSDVQRGLGAWA